MSDERCREGLGYRAYLLRLWQTTDGDRMVWRASLEQPGTGRRLGFAGLQELVSYLERTVADEPPTAEVEGVESLARLPGRQRC